MLLVISVYSFYSIAHYIAYPFYAEYQISEVGLGFTTGFASLIAAIGSIVRFIASKPVGRIADKYSFNKSMTVCFCFLAAAYAVMVFTVPANGKYMYLIYVILTSVASAGITSGVLNITYDYVSAENRTAALAINGAVAGLIGFVTTVAITPLFNYISSIREQGGKILGLTVYPTQLLSLIAFVLTVGLVIYNIFVIGKLKRNDELNNAVSEK